MTLFVGLAYALCFVVLCARRPQWALIAIFATSPLHFDLGNGPVKYSMTEVNLLLTLPLLALRMHDARRGLSLGPLTLPILAYLLVCGLSTFVNWQGSEAVVSWVQMFAYLVITVLIFSRLSTPDELRKVPYYLVGVCVFWVAVGIAVKFNFELLALRKNAFGASYAVGFLSAYDLWIARGYAKKPLREDWPRILLAGAMLIIFAGLIMTLSRGAWLGTIAGLFVIGLMRGSVKPLLKIGAALVPIVLIIWFNLPPQLKAYTFGFDTERNRNIEIRVETLRQTQDTFADSPVFGAGLGLRKQIDATNIVWLVLSETGVLGGLAFAWMFWNFYRMAWRARGILPPSDPRFTLLSLGAALMTYKLAHGMVDHYWTRGALTNAWAGAGMILCYCRIPIEVRARALQAQGRPATTSCWSCTPRCCAAGAALHAWCSAAPRARPAHARPASAGCRRRAACLGAPTALEPLLSSAHAALAKPRLTHTGHTFVKLLCVRVRMPPPQTLSASQGARC